MLEELKEALAPHVFEAIMSLITLALGYGTLLIRRWTGIQIEEKHMRALHSALRSGVLIGVERGLDKDALVQVAKDYARQSVPDAIRYLVPGEGVLESLILAKVQEVMGRAK